MSNSRIRVRWLASTARGHQELPRQEEDNDEQSRTDPNEHSEESDQLNDTSDEDEGEIITDDDEEEEEYDDDRHHMMTAAPNTIASFHTSCIEEAQLSPDGTCIFTSDHNRKFSVYPISPDIFSTDYPQPRSLEPYAQFQSPDPIWAFAANPYFDLSDANTTTVLVSQRHQYISLHNALLDVSKLTNDDDDDNDESKPPTSTSNPVNISTKLASYKLINSLTEAYISPLSLTFSHSGAYFYAGHQNAISIFDTTYTSSAISTIPTIPSKRSKLKGGGVGFKGHITSLSLSPPSTCSHEGILAAGSRTRFVGLYDGRTGEAVTHFNLPGATLPTTTTHPQNTSLPTAAAAHNDPQTPYTGGNGITQLAWHPSGTYLYIAERNSDALLLYDARNFSMALAHCTGRKARTNQKLGFSLWTNPYASSSSADFAGQGEGGECEVWAGGTDGKVRIWRHVWKREGGVEPDEVIDIGSICTRRSRQDGEGSRSIHGHDENNSDSDSDSENNDNNEPIVASLVHPSGNLAILARGRRKGSKWPGPRRGGRMEESEDRGCLDLLGLESDL